MIAAGAATRGTTKELVVEAVQMSNVVGMRSYSEDCGRGAKGVIAVKVVRIVSAVAG